MQPSPVPSGGVVPRSPAACTIVARNYLSHAKILAQSYLQHEPGGRFYTLVVDGLPEGEDSGPWVRVVRPEDLSLPNFFEMCFKYNVTELCTAVKPSLLMYLLHGLGEEQVIYFDPDILIARPLDELKAALGRADTVLTPHLLRPIPQDGLRPSEQDILIAGAYNLGFVALRQSAQTQDLLSWWNERLLDHCRVDPGSGLFVDQKWVDLVPGLFPSTAILTDDTYNVAYWNLHTREISREGAQFLVNGRPLAFFHFSGFNPSRRLVLSKHQTRIHVERGTPLAALLNLYADLHEVHGYRVSSRWTYAYSTFSNGLPVDPLMRQLYLDLDAPARQPFGNPFAVSGECSFLWWATAPAEGEGAQLSPFLRRLYRARADVAAAFPDVDGQHREAFLDWARTQGAREMDYPPEFALNRGVATAAVRSQVPATVAGGRGPGRLAHPENGADSGDQPHIPEGSAMNGVVASQARSLNGVLDASGPGEEPNQPEKALGPPRSTASVAGLNVAGYLRNETGLGAVARGYIRALRTLGVPLALRDLASLSPNRSDDPTLTEFDTEYPYDVNLVCVNADQHFVVMAHTGEEFFLDHYNIGVWFWELPSFPEEWNDRFAHYDEIWAATSFIANTLAPISPVPVIHIPPVLTPPRHGNRQAGRAQLGVEDDEFVCLFVFDFRSYSERKHPLGLIQAFKQAFDSQERVRLVLKSVNGSAAPDAYQAVRDAAAGHRISVYDGYWSAQEMQDVMAACDVYASLHRSEGLGLTISDAMALGKPVIATEWSGNTDFMNVSNSFPVRYELVRIQQDIGPYKAGQVWAEPSLDHAAELLRHLRDHPAEALERGERARRDVLEQFSEERVAAFIQQRLIAIGERRRKDGLAVSNLSSVAPGPEGHSAVAGLAPAAEGTDVGGGDPADEDVAAPPTRYRHAPVVPAINLSTSIYGRLGVLVKRIVHFFLSYHVQYQQVLNLSFSSFMRELDGTQDEQAGQLASLQKRAAAAEHHLSRVQDTLARLEGTLGGVADSLEARTSGVESLDTRLSGLAARVDAVDQAVQGPWEGRWVRLGTQVQTAERRIDQAAEALVVQDARLLEATRVLDTTEVGLRTMSERVANQEARLAQHEDEFTATRQQLVVETTHLTSRVTSVESSQATLGFFVEELRTRGDEQAAALVSRIEELSQWLAAGEALLVRTVDPVRAAVREATAAVATQRERLDDLASQLWTRVEAADAVLVRHAASVESLEASLRSTASTITDVEARLDGLGQTVDLSSAEVRQTALALEDLARDLRSRDVDRQSAWEETRQAVASIEARVDHAASSLTRDLEVLRARGEETAEQVRTVTRLVETARDRAAALAEEVRVWQGRVASGAEVRSEMEARISEEVAVSQRRFADLAGSAQMLEGRLNDLAGSLETVQQQLAARPFMARDVFGAFGDLTRPMGYALDAADVNGDPRATFPDLFRGERTFISERQRAYLPFLAGRQDVVDLGCGRGEFLELLARAGIGGKGVDVDPAHVAQCQALGLDVVQGDAVEYLRGLADHSLDVIFSAQFVEHLHPDRLPELLNVAHRCLRPGGLFIAETVNPENLVALRMFFVDLEHQKPIYPQVLLHLCREAGYPSARVFYPLAGGFTQTQYRNAGEYAVVAVA